MPLPPRPVSWPALPDDVQCYALMPELPPATEEDAGSSEEEEAAHQQAGAATMCCKWSCCTCCEERPQLIKKRERWLQKLHQQGENKHRFVYSLILALRTSEVPLQKKC